MKEVYLKIKGRVQGVGFRRWAEKQALQIGGISGWVRNAEDGSVEILMRGDAQHIEDMVIACHKGPWLARVDGIEFKPSITNFFLPQITDGIFERI
ncbi:MAG: acylphosphatase [Alphaproteobacteria bacterium]|nr:acylphosphatase [Alphaproteobacteria bacterium]